VSQFDSQTLEHLKQLCRIDCSEEEDFDILANMGRILDYIDQLGEINTEGVEPCSYVLRGMLHNLMREDTEGELLPRERFLANAPDQVGGMIRTPPVLKDL
jgi:aspartyl-tRNA(Asn)/glutamyl-tRNA(Gln) amidotransferase subunit C